MRKFTTRDLTLAAVLAAVYAALTITLPVPQYGAVQIRFAEAPHRAPVPVPRRHAGAVCGVHHRQPVFPFVLDVVFGSMATLLACLWTSRMTSRWLAPLPPVLCNAVIVGAEIAWAEAGITPAFWTAFGFNAVTVGLGELIACYALGSLLLSAMPQVPYFRGDDPGRAAGAAVFPCGAGAGLKIERERDHRSGEPSGDLFAHVWGGTCIIWRV